MQTTPIRFLCPSCQSILESPGHKGGQKIFCPKCQQKLQIPIENRTILAPLIPTNPPAPNVANKPSMPVDPASLPVASPINLPPTPAAPIPAPRRVGRFKLKGRLLVGAVAFVLVVGFVSMLVYQPSGKSAGRSMEKDGLRIGLLMIEKTNDCAVVYLLIQNPSDTKMVDCFDGVQPERFWSVPLGFKLTDEFGNKYQLPCRHPLLGGGGFVVMPPKDEGIFELLALAPVEKATRLTLTLPTLMLKEWQGEQTKDSYSFTVPIKSETVSDKNVKRTFLFKRHDYQEWFEKLDKRGFGFGF